MAGEDLRSLVGKLNDICRRSLEAAAGLTQSRSHYSVEVTHWLLKLIDNPNADLPIIFRHFGIDQARVITELTAAVDKLKTGHALAPSISPDVVNGLRDAWQVASVQYGAAEVRSGHILLALLGGDVVSSVGVAVKSPQLSKIPTADLRRDLVEITARSREAEGATDAAGAGAAAGDETGAAAPTGGGKTPSLDKYTVDLTARAAAGKIDPVLGRDAEIRQIVDILTRRRQNNPILTGEAGVGKTAVVEGFALRVAKGDVPPALKDVVIRTLDLGLLQAGAGVKGEFENRLKSVIEEVKGSPRPIITFIDEAHTMIGAGGQAGQGDAANLLKPALARGELRTIAATTWAEYKKYFEKDPALARRFQVVKVEEPTEAVAVEMMRGLVKTLEDHHKVRVLDEAVVESVRLSHRYIGGRQLPDKSVSLLDTACARVAMSQSATPAEIEDRERRVEQLDVEIRILEREKATGADHGETIAELTVTRDTTESELTALRERWHQEKELITGIRDLRDKIERAYGIAPEPVASGATAAADAGNAPAAIAEPPASDADLAGWQAELADLNARLRDLQGEEPLLSAVVDGQAIAAVVAAWTGIPVGRMVSNEIEAILNLRGRMEERIIGQSHALEVIAQAMRTSRAKLTDPRKPIGVFLMVGTSGVGKTETALTLAEILYGGEQNVTTINMSEFKEEHKVSLLVGSPPGYVGYGEGGVLTEAVRRRPYSVVLLDEMEKAHPGVQDVFYQVFDKGMLKDGEGRDIDFKNCVIIMTSNAGTDTIANLCADPETMPDEDGLLEALRPDLLQTFKPAFLGRVSIVPYFPLSEEIMRLICKLQLNRIAKRVRENYAAEFSYSDVLVDTIVARCTESETGARNIEHILSKTLLPELAARFLSRMAAQEPITRAEVSVDDAGDLTYAVT